MDSLRLISAALLNLAGCAPEEDMTGDLTLSSGLTLTVRRPNKIESGTTYSYYEDAYSFEGLICGTTYRDYSLSSILQGNAWYADGPCQSEPFFFDPEHEEYGSCYVEQEADAYPGKEQLDYSLTIYCDTGGEDVEVASVYTVLDKKEFEVEEVQGGALYSLNEPQELEVNEYDDGPTEYPEDYDPNLVGSIIGVMLDGVSALFHDVTPDTGADAAADSGDTGGM